MATNYQTGKALNGEGLYNFWKSIRTKIKTWIAAKQDKMVVGGATAGTVTTISEGNGVDITTSNGTATITNSLASTTERGGVKVAEVLTGQSVEGLNYVVKLNGVSSDTNYEKLGIPTANDSTAGVMSIAQATKLSGIESGAEANVQSDWEETDHKSDAFILNKPVALSEFNNDLDLNDFSNNSGFIKTVTVSGTGNGVASVTKNSANGNTITVTKTNFLTSSSSEVTSKQDKIQVGGATSGSVTKITEGDGIDIDTTTTSGTANISVSVASADEIGGIKIGASASENATIHTYPVTLTSQKAIVNVDIASKTIKGIVKLYDTNDIDQTTVDDTDAAPTVNAVYTTFAPKASPTLTGTPTAPTAASNTNNTQIATTAFVQTVVSQAVTGAAAFQGIIDGSTISEATIKASSYIAGQYWIVGTAGTYFGQGCEIGDQVYCITNKGTGTASNNHFNVIQNNVEWLNATEIDEIVEAVETDAA